MKAKLLAITAFLAVSLWSAVAGAAAIVGHTAPNFTATDSNGHAVSLSSYKGKSVVLEWMNPDCPFTQEHYRSGVMQSLQQDASDTGDVWLTINTAAANSASARSAPALNAWLEEMKSSPTALLIDSGAAVAKLYGAKTTPHMFVVDPDGILIYAGAIDDKRSVALEAMKVAHNYVRAALNESLDGKPVATASTQPYCCPVEY
ncbi:Peroxiredoxin [Pseudomonas delhiensis]|uniref:Peroxiredoxin n=1 Tax=Pseudomonas delhiensis TaxID=366289 RepID=A0A239IVE6_9PSED|nr:redoxin domain-containing protein [Pseudomonas delhiensis]SDK11404.1 Peroxiredoxin [Pseudomonas delhiensis]SNS97577.1 Peroxiredoxin [Pseudomonas delhiensis]